MKTVWLGLSASKGTEGERKGESPSETERSDVELNVEQGEAEEGKRTTRLILVYSLNNLVNDNMAVFNQKRLEQTFCMRQSNVLF